MRELFYSGGGREGGRAFQQPAVGVGEKREVTPSLSNGSTGANKCQSAREDRLAGYY